MGTGKGRDPSSSVLGCAAGERECELWRVTLPMYNLRDTQALRGPGVQSVGHAEFALGG
jgi:hypothetical protein